MSKESHIERTAHEPRDDTLHHTTISQITQINPTIRIIHLSIPPPLSIHFLPGQWLDVYPPHHPKPGGFTLTSPPSLAHRSPTNPSPYLELAIQRSPSNPAAAWLWQPIPTILHAPINVRVGGNFIWPPLDISLPRLRKAIFVAGGVGVNPLMSMLSALAEMPPAFEVHFLYSMRDPGEGERDGKGMLFLGRIAGIFARAEVVGRLKFFLSPGTHGAGTIDGTVPVDGIEVPFLGRRICIDDVAEIVGGDKDASVVYICGPPAMTDGFVEALLDPDGLGMEPGRVLFEKWW